MTSFGNGICGLDSLDDDDSGTCPADFSTVHKHGEKGHTCPREALHSMCSASDETHQKYVYVSKLPLLEDFSEKTVGLLTFTTRPGIMTYDLEYIEEVKGKAWSHAPSNVNPVMVIYQVACKWEPSYALSIFEDSAQCNGLHWMREHCIGHREGRSKWKFLWNQMKRKLQMLAIMFPFILIVAVCLKLMKDNWNRKSLNKEENISGKTQVQNEAVHGLVAFPLELMKSFGKPDGNEQLVDTAHVLAGDDSEVHSLKNKISELEHEHRKVCWRKDILIVAKTVRAQRLMEEVRKKNEAFKKLEAEVNEKDHRLCRLEKQLHTVKQEKESLAGEKAYLLNKISRYANDRKARPVPFFEMMKKVEEANLAQKENENEMQELRNQLKIQSCKSRNLQQQLNFLKEVRVQLGKEKGDICRRVSDLENEVNKISTDLWEMRKQYMETELAKVSAEKEVATLKNKMRIANEEIALLHSRMTAVQQRKKVLMTENRYLCNHICDYQSESRKLKAGLAKMKEQVKENDLTKTNIQKQIEELIIQLQMKNDEIQLLQERIIATQWDKHSLAIEKGNLCNCILDYKTKTEKMEIELCEMKQEMKQKYVVQKSTEKELEDQRNQMRLQNMEIQSLQSNIRALEEEKVVLVSRIKKYETEVGNLQKQLCEVMDEMRKNDLAEANTGQEVLNMRDHLQSVLDLTQNTDAVNHQEENQPLQVIESEADDSSSSWSSYSSDSDNTNEAEDCESSCSSDSPSSSKGRYHRIIRTRKCIYETSQQCGDEDQRPVRKIAKAKRRCT